jgi:hypothetical protein
MQSREMIYAAWGRDGRAMTLIGGEGPPQLQDEDNSELIWRIEADSWEEAMQKYYTLQGWGTYRPIEDLVELLTVAERFQLNYGLVVVPDFSVPDGWKNRSETVTIVLPDGKHRVARASLAVAHFRIPDSAASSDKRWRLVVSFPTMTEEDVPIGSKVMVPLSLRAAIQPR